MLNLYIAETNCLGFSKQKSPKFNQNENTSFNQSLPILAESIETIILDQMVYCYQIQHTAWNLTISTFMNHLL
jgi:hypothetical protein